MLYAILGSLMILCATPLAALFAGHRERMILGIGTFGNLFACVLGVSASLFALVSGEQIFLKIPWSLPIGKIAIGLDPLSSFFLVCIFLVSGLSALYGKGYFIHYQGKKWLLSPVFFFSFLVASMVGVVIARNGILFLAAWEIMSLSSFFLVTFENERKEVVKAGVLYLMASQAGVVFLFVLFTLLSRVSGSFDFNTFQMSSLKMPGLANTCFLLALVGFGTKAGFWPVHIWLPEAHPAAPSPVSAVMSGVMIKMGIYGLLRTLLFFGTPPSWWGGLIIGIGIVSGVLGVLHALTEHDLKRLLAYHSVENIGIIALGIGLGLLGQSLANPMIIFLGYSGALLHVLNHGLFKGLLFHGAGSVQHSTGTRNLDALGGLYRFMPMTGTSFLIGSAAICGLPPFNGFISEYLIYRGAFQGSFYFPTLWGLFALAIVPALALIGGLAVTCFVKAFGIIFLGNPRTEKTTHAHESNIFMVIPMIIGAVLCFVIGVFPIEMIYLTAPAADFFGGSFTAAEPAVNSLLMITYAAAVLFILIGLFYLLRRGLLRNRKVEKSETWSCGYPAYNPRMQYTAASFAEPVLAPFAPLIYSRIKHQKTPLGYFPEKAHYEKHLGDIASEKWLLPGIRRVVKILSQFRIIQQGRLQLYLLYIAATFAALLIWVLIKGGY
jgi:formate hydrogenlyase subunit 3/multisubunit Na+/H+ antiporter MnhD subunit